MGAPLGNTPGNPLGEPLGGSEETSGGTSEETSGRPLGGPLEEALGGTRRPTAGHFRTQQSLVRRRRGVEACIALPITLLAQAGSKSSTTGGTQNQRTQGQKYIRLKTVRDVTQVVRGSWGFRGETRASTLGVSLGARRGRPPWVSPRGSSGIDPLGGIDPRLRCKPSTSTSEFTSGPLTEACMATTGMKLRPPRSDLI